MSTTFQYTVHCTLWDFPTQLLNQIIPPNFSSQLWPHFFTKFSAWSSSLNLSPNCLYFFPLNLLTQSFQRTLHPICSKKITLNLSPKSVPKFSTLLSILLFDNIFPHNFPTPLFQPIFHYNFLENLTTKICQLILALCFSTIFFTRV